jgi:hypothetical protein
MNKQILKYTSAVALLLHNSATTAYVANKPDGTAGPAPCILGYTIKTTDA